ncbi:MAG: flavodoxin [Spirochaetales bacterium]|nr:flavodoxin [Spirochaetales bacterium]
MVAIIYGSSTMNTEYVSQRLAAAFGSDQETLYNVKGIDPAVIEQSRNIVLVTSTWGAGDLQDDWEEFFPRLEEMDFSGKVIGLVGVGDQENYPDTFCDGISHLYEVVVRRGGRVVGSTNTEGYNFKQSRSVKDGDFVGLVIDEDNQADRTDERIRDWVAAVSGEFA